MIRFFVRKIADFVRRNEGPTSVEYAIMIAVILVGAISAVLSTGDVQQSLFFNMADDMEDISNGDFDGNN